MYWPLIQIDWHPLNLIRLIHACELYGNIYLFLEVFLWLSFQLSNSIVSWCFLTLETVVCCTNRHSRTYSVRISVCFCCFCMLIRVLGRHIYPIHRWNFAPISSLDRRNNVKKKKLKNKRRFSNVKQSKHNSTIWRIYFFFWSTNFRKDTSVLIVSKLFSCACVRIKYERQRP